MKMPFKKKVVKVDCPLLLFIQYDQMLKNWQTKQKNDIIEKIYFLDIRVV